MIDLHAHTTASDGQLSPAKLVERAASLGVRVLAITDHDTLAGLAEARVAGALLGVEIVAGVEISAVRHGGGALHLLGYHVDERSAALEEPLERIRAARVRRNERIAERLTALGMPVSLEELRRSAGGIVGRPHFARRMVELGYVRSAEEAFDLWIGEGRPAYVDKEVLSPDEAIAVIRGAGGVAVLAHPLVYGSDPSQVESLLRGLVRAGLDGLEVYYGTHSSGEIAMLRCLSERYGLIATGGSDFHGEPHGPQPDVPAEAQAALLARAEKIRAREG